MSASFLKQPALFCKIMNKYIEFTTLLVNATVNFASPFRVDLFQTEELDVTTMVENCTYKPIEIKNIGSLNELLYTNIELLTHAIQEVASYEDELIVSCTKCVLEAYKICHLRIKKRCLQYFTALFRSIVNMDAELQPIIVTLIEYFGEVEMRLPIWTDQKLVKAEDITKYIKRAEEFLDSPHIVKLFQPAFLRQASHVALDVLSAHHKSKVVVYEGVIEAIYRFLSKTIGLVNDAKLYTSVSELVRSTQNKSDEFSQAVDLLEFVVGAQLLDSNVVAWEMVDQNIAQMLNNETSPKSHLLCLRAIFSTARRIEHNYSMHLQQQKAKSYTSQPVDLTEIRQLNDKAISMNCSRRLFGNMDAIGGYVLRCIGQLLTSHNERTSIEEIVLISELAVGMLSVSDCQDLDDYSQMQLLLFALCPFIQFSDLLYNHFQQAFETETKHIKRILLANRGPEFMLVWLSDALTQLSNLNLDYLSTKNKEIFMDFIIQLFTSITDSRLRHQIMEISIGLIIQDCYQVQNFHEYLLGAMNNDENRMAVSENLCTFLCLATSSSCHAFQTVKNGRFEYEIICRDCSLRQSNDVTMDAGAFLQLVDKVNGKYVQTTKNSHIFSESSSWKYFQLFQSEDPRIRCNMAKCVPALLNHLYEYAFNDKYMDLWLSPVLDDNPEVRLGMMTINRYQSAVRVSLNAPLLRISFFYCK